MFKDFADAHAAELTKPIFADGLPGDAFFKSTETFPAPPTDGPHERAPLEGPVVFYGMEAQNYAVCLAIGEIYRASVREHLSASANNVARRLLPTLTLLDFYSVLYHTLPEDSPHREAIGQNVIDLCEAAEVEAPGTGPGAIVVQAATAAVAAEAGLGLDGTLGMLTGLISTLSGGRAPASELSTAVKSVTDVVGMIIARITSGTDLQRDENGAPEAMALVDRIGDVFKTPEVQRQIADATQNARSSFASLAGGL